MYISFNSISNKAKVWVYILSDQIDKLNSKKLEEKLISLCDNWKSHGVPINSTYLIFKNQFILLFAEENNVSGCSIDSTYNYLRKSLNQLNMSLDSNSKIGIFIDNKILLKDRNSIINLINKKLINKSNKMINTTVLNKEDYLKNWILSINDSWLNNFI